MEKLNNILCEVFRLKGNELDDKLTMEDIESWDSLTHMDLITSIEEGLNIQNSNSYQNIFSNYNHFVMDRPNTYQYSLYIYSYPD